MVIGITIFLDSTDDKHIPQHEQTRWDGSWLIFFFISIVITIAISTAAARKIK